MAVVGACMHARALLPAVSGHHQRGALAVVGCVIDLF